MPKVTKRVIVKILIYDSHGVDNGLTKEFNSLRDALDYIFEELDEEPVELCKTSTNEYVFTVEDSDEHIEYRILLEEQKI